MNLLKHKGGTIIKPITDERDGSKAGFNREHWDDRVEATAFLKAPYINVPSGGFIMPGLGRLVAATHETLADIVGAGGRRVRPIAGSAFANSGMFLLNWIDILDNTQLAIDLSLTTHKWALYTNTKTPDFSADAAYSATNEISGTNYTAGGRTIAAGGGSPTNTESPTGTIMYDQSDMVWPTATFTARGAELYADALAGDNLIVAQTFGADITATAASFTIQFASGGVLTLDLTP